MHIFTIFLSLKGMSVLFAIQFNSAFPLSLIYLIMLRKYSSIPIEYRDINNCFFRL